MHPRAASRPAVSAEGHDPQWPLSLTVDALDCMLNFDLADHPVYDGIELQWLDDERHGTGMIVFLQRRADRRVDYYATPELRVDRTSYNLGAGTGAWYETDFEVARLSVDEDGVDAEVRFADVDGRSIEVRIDDRDGRPRRRVGFLAPVSTNIDEPTALMLVWMPSFDLVRVGKRAPVVRIDGIDAAIGRVPLRWLHRRHLIKYCAPLVAIEVNREPDVPANVTAARAEAVHSPAPGGPTLQVDGGGSCARLTLNPPWPDLSTLPAGTRTSGVWHVAVDGVRLTGGRWTVEHAGKELRLGIDVTERWRPGRLPWLLQVITTVLPMFRRWPTTYRWRARARLGPPPTLEARWERVDP